MAAIDRIESHECLIAIKASSFPYQEKDQRTKTLKNLQNAAYPRDNENVLTSVEFAKRLGIYGG